jgi:hypothetical protein
MSGSGPGPSPGPSTDYDNCLFLSKITALASPNPTVLATLSKGDTLLVSSSGTSLDILTATGQKCGAVISDVSRFIECIKQGHEYVAIVTDISGGKCTLQIRIK